MNSFRLFKIKSQFQLCAIFVIAAMIICAALFPVYAEGEDGAEDTETVEEINYEPSEYRLNNDSINEWEDRVLIAATGKLESEGRVYYAYGEYVEELISYFSKDDIDLTEKEAKDAITEISNPENARAGALSGYLYQIGGKPKDTDSLIDNGEYDGKVYPEFDETIRFADENEYKTSDLYLNNKEYIEERTNTVYESQSAMREEMRRLALADRTYQVILESKPADATLKKIIASKGVGNMFAVIAAIMLLLTALVIIYGWRNGTISALNDIDDESWKRSNSHKDRHRIRKRSALILAAVCAIDLAVVYAGLTFYSTFGSDNYIEKAMDKSGISQHCYMEFREDVHDFLVGNSIPQNSLDRALTYRDYRFDYIKGVRSAIKHGSSDVAYRGIRESVQAQIDLLAYITKKDSNAVVSGIEKIYEESLSADVGVILHDLRASIGGAYIAGLILCLVSFLFASVMLLFERHNLYRGIKDLAIGVLAGTVLWALMIAAVMLKSTSLRIGLENDQAFALFTTAVEGIKPMMLTLLGISAVVTLLLFGVSRLTHRRG